MSGSRTEQPTPRRLREARRRGEVSRSDELSAAAALAGGLVGVLAVGPGAASELARGLRAALASAVWCAEPWPAARTGLATVLRLSVLPACAALTAAALAAALQAGPGLSPEALRPRLERLDPLRGLARLCSPSQLARSALGIAKGAVLLAIAWAWFRSAAPLLSTLPRQGPEAVWRALPLLAGLALRLAAALAAFGAIDFAVARARHRRALLMTRDEVRRERKEDEGDPEYRAERRRLHRALLEAGGVSRATVVVVNPTSFAVALRHDRDGDEAPRVIAKGRGAAAARIRSAARRAGVPIVRDVPLARALHRLADVGDEIPEQLYEAAAAVLAHLYGTEAP